MLNYYDGTKKVEKKMKYLDILLTLLNGGTSIENGLILLMSVEI
jgi:hypothetical protein